MAPASESGMPVLQLGTRSALLALRTYGTAAAPNGSLGLRTTGLDGSGSSAFDYTPSAKCAPGYAAANIAENDKEPPLTRQPSIGHHYVVHRDECEALCRKHHECVAAEFHHWGPRSRFARQAARLYKAKVQNCASQIDCIQRYSGLKVPLPKALPLPPAPPTPALPTCVLHRGCLQRDSAPAPGRVDVMHRWGPTWPPVTPPSSVRWTTNASLVVVSYDAPLDWLATLPGGIADLVFYQKHNYRAGSFPTNTARKVLNMLRREVRCGRVPRLFLPSIHGCPRGCHCGEREPAQQPQLAYFALLPNYGLTHRKPFGGSREPYGFLQYLLDFWDNLPPVTIFTQDDCLKDGCSWGNALTQMRLMLQSWPKFWGIDRLTGAPMPITPENCLCRIYNENTFAKNKKYYWYRWMSFVQQHLLGTVPENRSTHVHWPQDATFAVSRLVLRSQPRWMYEALLRMTTVENACFNAGTIHWAHSFERLWFELLDSKVPKIVDAGPDGKGMCMLGARRL